MCNEHINEELLELYSMGRLGEPKLGEVEEHLLLCDQCQDRLEEVDGFVKVFRQASRQASETRADYGRRQREEPGRVWQWVRPVWAAAAASAAVLLVTFVLPPRSVDEPSQTVDLRAFRGESASGSVTAEAGRRLDLRMDAAGIDGPSTYRLEIVNGAGGTLWTGRPDRHNDILVVSAPAVRRGQYWVRLLNPKGETVREFGLRVR
jgi:hypothetical protein